METTQKVIKRNTRKVLRAFLKKSQEAPLNIILMVNMDLLI